MISKLAKSLPLGEKFYYIWTNIKNRCFNKDVRSYKDYGARGITVCSRWLGKNIGFKNFYNDMIGSYKEGLQIDRIDNDGNYEPSNCRWITSKEQACNRRSNVWIEYKGDRKTIYQWAKHLGVNGDLFRRRIRDYGWSIEKSVNFIYRNQI
jgi:hypothetical protein